MVRFTATLLTVIAVFCLSVLPVQAKNSVLTDIKVIYASKDASHIDPAIGDIVEELGSLFQYTDYRLLKEKRLMMSFGQKGTVNLPGNKSLEAVPKEMKGNRIPYQIQILKNSKTTFKTEVLLKDGSSITIGGPKYKNGMLLINIAGSAQ